MDTLARGLLIANDILENSDYLKLKNQRYKSFQSGHGHKFSNNNLSLSDLSELALNLSEPELISGKQEFFESLINKYI